MTAAVDSTSELEGSDHLIISRIQVDRASSESFNFYPRLGWNGFEKGRVLPLLIIGG